MKTVYTVITGASSGIGKSLAFAFAEKGKNIILVARRTELLEEIKLDILEKYPQVIIVVRTCDLTQTDKLFVFYNSLSMFHIETWINNAGIGMYSSVENSNLTSIDILLNLNISAVTILSTLFVRDYKNVKGTQLINISSSGGYTIVPNAVIYCASKFYVNSFTEGLAKELIADGSDLKAKVLAPSATKTNFGKTANQKDSYDYDVAFSHYNTSAQMAEYLLQLHASDSIVGYINRENFTLELSKNRFEDAYLSKNNQSV